MDAIRSYLDNMFANLPHNSQVEKAKTELLQMMEDKYSELKSQGKSENEAVGAVISEFGNLDELSIQLGISNQVNESKKEDNSINMSGDETAMFLNDTRDAAPKIALGVALCILGVVPLMLLAGFGERLGLSETIIAVVGVPLLLIFVAIAVYMFITSGLKTERYEKLEKQMVVISQSVATSIRNAQESFRPTYIKRIALGVVQIFIGVIIVVIAAILGAEKDMYVFPAVAVLLILVADAAYNFVRVGMEEGAYEKLLNTGDYTPERKEGNKHAERIAPFYWPLVTAGYLAYSFITGRWDYSWIIWPVAGVLWGFITALVGAMSK